MQPTTSNNDSQPIFPYHDHNQADFHNPFIIGRGFIYLGISKMSFTKYLQEFKVAYQYRQLEKLLFDYTPNIGGSWKSHFKIFEFKCL